MAEIKVETTALIRKSPEEIFRYFIEPSLLSKFWLSEAEAPLKVGKTVRWDFMVPGATAMTTATEIDQNRKISWDWDDETKVTITFEPLPEGTRVHLVQTGFNTSEKSITTAITSTEGFTIVLCDLKAMLESGQSLKLVSDKAFLIRQKNKK